MSESTPATRHAKKLLDEATRKKMVESTLALEAATIQALRKFFVELREDPEVMLERSSASSGPALSQNMAAAILIQVPFPLTDTAGLNPSITSSAKYERFDPDHVTFVWEKPLKPE